MTYELSIGSENTDGRLVTPTSEWTVQVQVPDWKRYAPGGPLTPPVSIEIKNTQDVAVYWRTSDRENTKARIVPANEVDSVDIYCPNSFMELKIHAASSPSSGVVRVSVM